MTDNPNRPIGIFDSGVGGLTVMKALMEALPQENLIYFGDNARVPYGVKSPETIIRYARQIAQFLLAKQVKLLIMACNTMSAVAKETVSQMTSLPVIDVIDTGAKMALSATRNRRIGVIGTPATINSKAYVKALNRYDSQAQIFSRPCPLFVPLVEEGWLNHQVTRLTAEEYLHPLLKEGIDVLVLGCTHYPLIKPLLKEIAGPGITLIDSAEAVAHNTLSQLREMHIQRTDKRKAVADFFITDAPERFHALGESFLKMRFPRIQLVEL